MTAKVAMSEEEGGYVRLRNEDFRCDSSKCASSFPLYVLPDCAGGRHSEQRKTMQKTLRYKNLVSHVEEFGSLTMFFFTLARIMERNDVVDSMIKFLSGKFSQK